MTLSQCRCAKVDQTVQFRPRLARTARRVFITALMLLASLTLGCSEASKRTDANSSAGTNTRPGAPANSNNGSRAAGGQPIDIKELERYSVAMTISIQETASSAPMLTQELTLARLGADRRWAFLFAPPLGQVVYLEKSGLRYLVLFDRRQYIELNPNVFGFEPAKVLTPNSIVERLKSHQYEKLGLEPVNGRTAIKYRVTEAGGGSAQADGIVFVDQETTLPLRCELNAVTPPAKKLRVVFEVRDVQLNPDRAQFDVPTGMKKVTQQEASQQVEAFARALRTFADTVSGTPSGPVAGVTQPAANKNAGRSGR
jgi:hypothetical protein